MTAEEHGAGRAPGGPSIPGLKTRVGKIVVHVAGMAAVLAFLAISSTYNYLFFHSIVEIFTLVISFSIFILVWNGREYIDDAFFLVIGVGFLFSGGIDLLHTLAYKGMGVFSFGGADLPTQLWIAARYLQASSLLAAPLLSGRNVRLPQVFAAFGAVFVMLLAAIFSGVFPHCFIEGQGLTPFKIYSEYAISAMLIVSIVLLYRIRERFEPDVLACLMLANAFTIGAEISFTTYVSVYGFANMLGHLLRLVAVYLWYLAFLSIGQKRPFDLLWRDLKKKEETLEKSEEKYRRLFASMFEGVAYCRMIYDASGQPVDWEYLEVNPAFYRLTGLKDIVGRRVRDAIPGIQEQTPELFEIYGRVASTGRPETFDIYFSPLEIWLHISVSSPEKGYFIALFEDITEKKKSEAHLSYLSAIIEHSNDAVIGKSLEGVITSWNAGAERIYGYSAEEAIGQHISFIVPHGQVESSREMIDRIRNGEAVVQWEGQRRTKDGRLIDVALTSSPIRGAAGDLIGVSTIARDVTEQKAAGEALRRSEARFRNYIEHAPDGIFVADERGNYLMVNRAACEITGYTRDELLEKNIRDLIPPADHPLAFEHFRQVKGEGEATEELRFVTKDGEVRYWLVKAVRINSEELLGFASDITERKMMEAEIRSLNTVLEQKVEERTRALEDANVALKTEIVQRKETENQLKLALNEKILLLREVHHRVKNNLQIIISLSNLQLRQIEDPKMRQVMAETQNRVRAMALVHEKLYKSESLSDIDLAEYVRFLTSNLFAFYETDSRKVALKTEIRKITLPINTAIPLGLIINELVSNALKHAFPPGRGGVLSISANRDGDTITLAVKDTGIGIPGDLDWRNAQSLGLRLVISLVNQLDGTIDLDRTEGTAFTMVLKVKE
ncbi:MAG TPA: MASE3 domain-containing protein [Methanolinea sp.]|nr:MASE3 domain-containing protein [Methanolinea sp.]HQK55467.1 MASE3 domain-containing protein [Methanolinea sp.]